MLVVNNRIPQLRRGQVRRHDDGDYLIISKAGMLGLMFISSVSLSYWYPGFHDEESLLKILKNNNFTFIADASEIDLVIRR